MQLLLALALAVAPVPTEVPETPQQVEDPAARAARHFDAGEFVEAADAFEQAFTQTGDPAFVFGRAQALRRAGNCAAAIEELERFIALAPPAPDVEEANRVIDSCKRVLGIDDEPPPPVVEPAPPPVVDIAPPPAKPKPWHRDAAGAALLGSGLAVAAIGAGLLGGSYVRARDRDLESETQWQTRGDTVRTLSVTGIVLLALGGALTIAGAARWGAVARRDRNATRPQTAAR
ncbi:MAG TPA: hypothetical protein VG755_44085 [Nannocystaceae bacterium]|nr:hypothetical protein [Nannocystaceae bacterium]